MRTVLFIGGMALAVIAATVYLALEDEVAPQGNEIIANDNVSEIEIVADGLDIPWDIAFLPDGGLLVTERDGQVVRITDGHIFPVEGIVPTGEAGLLGIALHPEFAENRYVYLYFTTSVGEELENNIVRYIYADDALTVDRVIVDDIPASRVHDGGRIAFGPDGHLYATVGDAGNEDAAADPMLLNGTILRMTDEGVVPEDNPFGNAVYSYGHRNPQGLAWDEEDRLWSTEHGRSGIRSGYDEINLIVRAGNYGWPESEGDAVADGTVAPAWHSSANSTWAPASAAIIDDRLFFGGLRGEALYEATISDGLVTGVRAHFEGEFGRVRTVTVGPDGMLYLTTSNRDGRGSPEAEDDKIVRIDPSSL